MDLKVAVARLDDIDYSLEIWGIGDEEEIQDWLEVEVGIDPLYLGSFSGDDLSGDIDLGTIIVASGDRGYLAAINWGKKELIIEDPFINDVEKVDLSPAPYPATILPDFDNPVLFDLDDDAYLTPASAMMLKTNKSIASYYPDPISMVFDAGTINLVYKWAVALVDDDDFFLGITQGVDPADVSGTSTTIDKVLDYNAISGDVEPGTDFKILFVPDGQGIAEFTVNTTNPSGGTGDICALPMVIEFAITGDMIDDYDSDLAEAMELRLDDDPSEENIIEVIRDFLFLEKDWGTKREKISLMSDAVDISIEEDEQADETYIIFRVYMLIVDGGVSGSVEEVDIDGQSYLVIYDGNEDGIFDDPLRLLGSSAGFTTGGGDGGGGCSLGMVSPLFILFLIPLFFVTVREYF